MTQETLYVRIGEHALGTRARGTINGVMVLYTLLSCVSYVVLVGDFAVACVDNLVDSPLEWELNRLLLSFVVVALVMYPFSFVKNLEPLKFTSMLGLICMFLASGVVIGSAPAQ
jgi:amino acid permease